MQATAGERTARRQVVAHDRNQADRYLALVFFDSYESAMLNSDLPQTQALAQRYQQLTRELTFHDLDVISDEDL
jgi:hypothetical protein